ncbi:hypothetical protein [Streptomyces bohaiensis]|uniref:DUF732 domain-containing protein n=1 Tax=Streptomyces bohaiensis TaxID=1431344 RepID=A0ABX1CG06_9ACTN|nr:hypothetical protein [Streptomyces bohaiensis]NJQ16087.1 hypothetical protein [Streptomyces bohaiensis]
MSGRRGGALLATVLTATLLAGCGSGRDDGESPAAPAGSAADRAPSDAPGADPADEGADGSADDTGERDGDGSDGSAPGSGPDGEGAIDEEGARDGERVPEVPVEFTEDQREFLDAREAPRGADPGALLLLGEEACERLGYLSRHAPEAVPEAVENGEIPGAEEAVAHLCPEHAPAG